MNQIQVAAQSQVPAQPVPPFAPVQIGLSEESKLALLDHWRSIKKRKWPILGWRRRWPRWARRWPSR